MSAAVALAPDPARVIDDERTSRPDLGRMNPSVMSYRHREGAAGRLVWRTHDTPPVWLPGETGPDASSPADRSD